MKNRLISSSHTIKGTWWIRILGYGISWTDHKKHKPLFSERNGFRKAIHIYHWCFMFLRPEIKIKKYKPKKLILIK